MNPLINSGYLPNELSTLLFPPALSSLKNLHNSFENNLKQRKIEHNSVVGDIGDLLLSMVRQFQTLLLFQFNNLFIYYLLVSWPFW